MVKYHPFEVEILSVVASLPSYLQISWLFGTSGEASVAGGQPERSLYHRPCSVCLVAGRCASSGRSTVVSGVVAVGTVAPKRGRPHCFFTGEFSVSGRHREYM